MTGSIADGFEAAVVQKVGPVKARFAGVVHLSDIVEGRSVKISGEGKGGAAGFAKGRAVVTFEPVPEGTSLTYEVEANVGGKLAQLGSRIIDGFAKKMADDFFAQFQAVVEGEGAASTEPEAVADQQVVCAAEDEIAKKGWFTRLVGGGGSGG
jgi:carbon monoxide dehydrogenase subunit G